MNEIRAISLDLDDTLWAIAPVIERAERAVHAWLAEHCPRVIERYTIERLRGVRAELVERHPERLHDLGFLRRATLARCIEGEGYGSEAVDEAFEVFYAARNEVELFEDVLPVLAPLAERYVLVAVTNGNADLAAVGVDEYFEHFVNAAQVGAAKPDAAIFEAAIALCDCAPSQLLHVGDDPTADVLGAHRAGLRAAWLNRRGSRWELEEPVPELELASLYDLLDLFGIEEAGDTRRQGLSGEGT